MRKLLEAVVVTGAMMGLIAPMASAAPVTTTIVLNFEDLGSYPYVFAAGAQFYENHPLAQAGVTLTSTSATPPTARDDSSSSSPPPGTAPNLHDLIFSTDLTLTAFPNSSTRIVAFDFWLKNTINVNAGGIGGTNYNFNCGGPIGTWCRTGLFNLGARLLNGEYEGVDKITLSADTGVIDEVSLTLRYESSSNNAPEPASVGLAMVALAGAGVVGRRRRR